MAVCGLVVMTLATPVHAESPSAAFDRWLARAEQGELEAQYTVGTFYERGYGRLRHYVLASNFYERAADGGHAAAAYRFGRLYLLGLGVPQNIDKARRYFEMARVGGAAEASLALGILARDGIGEPADPDRALALFAEAADRGLARARFQYGLLLLGETGESADADTTAAADAGRRMRGNAAVREAAAAGVPAAQLYLAQIGEGAEALRWTKIAADAGYPAAALLYAEQLLTPDAATSNTELARGYLYIAASALLPEAQYRLGLLHARGEGVPIDDDVATYWFGRASLLGHVPSQAILCLSLARGRGIGEDVVGAAAWCRVAREAGNADAAEAEPLLLEALTAPQHDLVDLEYERIRAGLAEKLLELRAARFQ